jgi:hypothetical protein
MMSLHPPQRHPGLMWSRYEKCRHLTHSFRWLSPTKFSGGAKEVDIQSRLLTTKAGKTQFSR